MAEVTVTSTEAGELTAPATLTAPVYAEGTEAGELTAPATLTAPVYAEGTEAGELAAPATLTAPVYAEGTEAGELAAPATLTGPIDVSGTEAGELFGPATLSEQQKVSGTEAGELTAPATLTGPIDVSGTEAGELTAPATLTGPIDVSGTEAGELTAPATLTGPIDVSGTEAGELTAPATLTGPIDVSGTEAGELTAPATLTGPIDVSGTEAGELTAPATLTGPIDVSGTEAGELTAPATLTGPIDVSGTEAGELTAPASLAKELDRTTDLDVSIVLQFTRTCSLNGLVQTVESLTASLSATIAELTTRTVDASVAVGGLTTRTADASVAIAELTTRTADASVAIAELTTQTASLDLVIVPIAVPLDVAVAEAVSKTSSLDFLVAEFETKLATLDVFVRIVVEIPHTIDVYLSNTREFTIPIDVLLGGTPMLYTDVSVTIQGEEHVTAELSSYIEARRPYSLLRIWGDRASRFFGGNASDANFFEHFEPHPAATVNTGVGNFSLGDRRVTYDVSNAIPTPAAYDKYSLALNAPADTSVVGFRMLFGFDVTSFGPNSILLLGGFTGTNDPVTDRTNGDFVGFAIEAEQGIVHFRGWAGTNEGQRNVASGLGIQRFVGVPLVLEIETVGATGALADLEFRLYDASVTLERPIVTIPLETSTPPAITHAGMTSLGRRTPEQSTAQPNMHVSLRYVDVEPGTGAVYQAPWYSEQSDAKWRPYLDRPPLQLTQEGRLLLEETDYHVGLSYVRFDQLLPTASFIIAEPSGSDVWRDYRVSADVAGACFAGGVAGGFGLALYRTGTSGTTDCFAGLINTNDNQFYEVKIVNGVVTSTGYAAASVFGSFVDNETYRLELDARTDAAGQTIVNFFVNRTLLFTKLWTSGPVEGPPAAMYRTAGSAPTYRNLSVRSGMNDIFVDLSDDGVATTDVQYDDLFVDDNDPIITVHAFWTESPIIVPESTNPQVVKGSANTGFSGVSMQWSASHSGRWTLRVDSTGATNGTEIRSGTYPTADETVVLGWDFAELPQVDGIYDVTLYVIADSGKPAAKKLGQYLLP